MNTCCAGGRWCSRISVLMDVEGFETYIKSHLEYRGQIAHVRHLPRREARFGELAKPVHRALELSLKKAGAESLYSHQALAVNLVREGESVAVVTGTASGKSLCYNIPVLDAVLKYSRDRAMYLFPTKALAQDQIRMLGDLTRDNMPFVRFDTFDGDTPQSRRNQIKRYSQILLTNPDMLHVGILPNHTSWSKFLSNLRYVVVDEAHVYRGVFGSQVANVIRRLRRLCRFYGSDPQFICCSATIANPAEHIKRLTGVEVTVVDDDGSPGGTKDFFFWNPPVVDKTTGMRRSPYMEATFLFSELVRAGIRTVTFTKARKIAELILMYARDSLRRSDPELVQLIKSYRAGYLAEDRRQIERELFSGQLLGVAATNALELGVDIGSLDATILTGYPGSIASTWQQAGRSGRRESPSLSVLVALADPLDQYLVRHPEAFFGRGHEHALIDPDNPYILADHLLCAAFEKPLSEEDAVYFGEQAFLKTLEPLEESRRVQHRDRWYYNGPSPYPARDVSIRSTSGENYTVIDLSQGGKLLETVDGTTAFQQLHAGAVYLHQGESYYVQELNLTTRTAYVVEADVDYYTQPQTLTDVRILEEMETRRTGGGEGHYGRLRVTEQVIGYRRKQQFTESVLGESNLDLPPQSFETLGLWFDIPADVEATTRKRELDFLGGLHAAEHACIAMLPLFAMCDRRDIGGLSTPAHPDTGKANVFIYDAYPGGVGIADKGYRLLEHLWVVTLQTIEECECEDGCPSCIQSPKCGSGNHPLDKAAAVIILDALAGPACGVRKVGPAEKQ
jgi:DEAD/DEAH box helicase domain-containing protein